MSVIIYLDESGDLGWTFDAPYRSGGSSRYLTVGAACVPPEKKHFPKRVVKNLYKQFGWPIGTEIKWVDMPSAARKEFAIAARSMCDKYADIHLHGVVVQETKRYGAY